MIILQYNADVDVAEFDSIVQELKTYDERREIVIKRSRDIQKASKQAIFSLHRNAVQEAEQRLNSAATAAADILPLIEEMPTLRGGSYSNAVEEYAEAVCFLTYLREGRLPSRFEVKLAEVSEVDWCAVACHHHMRAFKSQSNV
jgi:predicted translin family RNA/ssDNA-binding protein